MRKIEKGAEPQRLTEWKRSHVGGTYSDLSSEERQEIRFACLQEQYYLCAYCCNAITGDNDDCVNEHVEARKLAPCRSLDYSNIAVSCKTRKQCDRAHRSQPLNLTPLMQECETQLLFKISGRVEGLTDRAKETIRVLNLGDSEAHNRKLIETRKDLVYGLLLRNDIDPQEGVEDDDFIKLVIDDLLAPLDGKLESFAPVVANILRSGVGKGDAFESERCK